MVGILVTLVLIGLLLWIIEQIPIDATIRRIIHVVAVVLVVLWLISVFFGGSVIDVPVPRIGSQ